MKKSSALKYAGHVIFHPFDGFWDLKNEKRGDIKTAILFLALTIFTFILKQRYTGFLFNLNNVVKINIFIEIGGVLLLFFTWTTSNWCLTSLMDGKGTYKDIIIATGYSVVPYFLINLPLVLLSQVMVNEEAAFYSFFYVLSLIWCIILLVAGTMMTHDYSFSKTAGTIICILVGMAIIVFLLLLLVSILQEMINLVVCVYREINFRF